MASGFSFGHIVYPTPKHILDNKPLNSFIESLKKIQTDSVQIYQQLDEFLTKSPHDYINLQAEYQNYKYISKTFKLEILRYFKWIHDPNILKMLFAISTIDRVADHSTNSPYIFESGIITLEEFLKKILLDKDLLPFLGGFLLELGEFNRTTANKIWCLVCRIYFDNLHNKTLQSYVYQTTWDRITMKLKDFEPVSQTKDTFQLKPNTFSKFEADTETLDTLVRLMSLENYQKEFPNNSKLMSYISNILKQNQYSPSLLNLIPLVMFSTEHCVGVFRLLREKSNPDHFKFKVAELIESLLRQIPGDQGHPKEFRLLKLLKELKNDALLFFKDGKLLGSALSVVLDWIIQLKFSNYQCVCDCINLLEYHSTLWFSIVTPQQIQMLREQLDINLLEKSKLENPTQYISPLIEFGQLDIDMQYLIHNVLLSPKYENGKFSILNYILQKKMNHPDIPMLIEYLKETLPNRMNDNIQLQHKTIEILYEISQKYSHTGLLYFTVSNLIWNIEVSLSTKESTTEYLSLLENIFLKFSKEIMSNTTCVERLKHCLKSDQFLVECMISEKYNLVVVILESLIQTGTSKDTLYSLSLSLVKCSKAEYLNTQKSPHYLGKLLSLWKTLVENPQTIFLGMQVLSINNFSTIMSSEILRNCDNLETQLKPLEYLSSQFPTLFEGISYFLLTELDNFTTNNTLGDNNLENQVSFILKVLPSSYKENGILNLQLITRKQFEKVFGNIFLGKDLESYLSNLLKVSGDIFDFSIMIHYLSSPKAAYKLFCKYPKILDDPTHLKIVLKALELPKYHETRKYLLSQSFLPLENSLKTIMDQNQQQQLITRLPDILISKILNYLIIQPYQNIKFKISLATISRKFFDIVKKLMTLGFESKRTYQNWFYKREFIVKNPINRESPWCLLQNLRLTVPVLISDFDKIDHSNFSNLYHLSIDSKTYEQLNLRDKIHSLTTVKHVVLRIFNLDQLADPNIFQQVPNIETLEISLRTQSDARIMVHLGIVFTKELLDKLKKLIFHITRSTINLIPQLDQLIQPLRSDLKTIIFLYSTTYTEIDARIKSVEYDSFLGPNHEEFKNIRNLIGLKKLVIPDSYAIHFKPSEKTETFDLPSLKKISISTDFGYLKNLFDCDFWNLPSLKVLQVSIGAKAGQGLFKPHKNIPLHLPLSFTPNPPIPNVQPKKSDDFEFFGSNSTSNLPFGFGSSNSTASGLDFSNTTSTPSFGSFKSTPPSGFSSSNSTPLPGFNSKSTPFGFGSSNSTPAPYFGSIPPSGFASTNSNTNDMPIESIVYKFIESMHSNSTVNILRIKVASSSIVPLIVPLMNDRNEILSSNTKQPIWYVCNDMTTFYRI
ncbi:hypothetical protein DLAC_02533 [Tieghemostelium lacteum]|uniref:Uncharacterized protein n=1 Tax=Tieghemostelium lacteum TaxID=361077 RepID=A0A152A2P0_TIELA|nr:hypothetical protein DLAC_02533 [Tieghemostelium lacteum]|eukprot:KYR00522.1 hypothetical protein DLAC_02533 [Tieghemostelium lacteum]